LLLLALQLVMLLLQAMTHRGAATSASAQRSAGGSTIMQLVRSAQGCCMCGRWPQVIMQQLPLHEPAYLQPVKLVLGRVPLDFER
jgi:hypothetical protein